MERFKNIGSRRRLDVKAVCRCCGLENEEKYPILGANPFSDDVPFYEKVFKLTGINVQRTDKMPQSMCMMCADKINDFFEFRLMAENTETQTRQALGLPSPRLVMPHQQQQSVPVPRIIETKPIAVRLFDIKYSIEDKALIERAFARQHIPSTSKKRVESTVTTSQPPQKKSKKELSCSICSDSHFSYQSDLNDHLMKDHVPLVAKYACGSCRETFEQLSDHKAHESMHSRDKLPYTCYFCHLSFVKPSLFNKHMTNFNCSLKEKLIVTAEDIKCFQCKKKFLTQNLFEWHGCFLKTRGTCSKCGQYFPKKKALFKHYVLCEGLFETPECARDPNMKVKFERSNNSASVKVSTTNPEVTMTKGPKKKTVPQRKMSLHPNIVKSELQLEAPEDDEYANYEEDITYDNFGNDSDSDEATNAALVPVVEMQDESSASSTVKIKQEKLNDQPAIQQQSNTPQLIRNIKKEKGVSSSTVVTTVNKPLLTQQQKNHWKLKIKAEKSGAGLVGVAQVLNPMAVGATNQTLMVRKKVFKMPQELAMKIKLEKKDAAYGDDMEERDEAEPEDEDLMPDTPETNSMQIKKEKVDPAYGDSCDSTKSKQFINPMALMMREKSNAPSNGFPVITKVTSINEISSDTNHVDGTSKRSEFEANNTLELSEETNDACEREKNNSTKMVQIPWDCFENQKNHSSQLALAPVEVREDGKIAVIEPLDSGDDLDALLKKYEDEEPPDSNELFNDLLKFD